MSRFSCENTIMIKKGFATEFTFPDAQDWINPGISRIFSFETNPCGSNSQVWFFLVGNHENTH